MPGALREPFIGHPYEDVRHLLSAQKIKPGTVVPGCRRLSGGNGHSCAAHSCHHFGILEDHGHLLAKLSAAAHGSQHRISLAVGLLILPVLPALAFCHAGIRRMRRWPPPKFVSFRDPEGPPRKETKKILCKNNKERKE